MTIHALLGFAPQKGMLGYYKMPACLCQDLFPRFLLISIYFYLFGNLILWILDEAPMAYKSLEDIIDVVSESVDVVEVMKPVFNFKAS